MFIETKKTSSEIIKDDFNDYQNLKKRIAQLIIKLLYNSSISTLDVVEGETYEFWKLYPTCTYTFMGYRVITSKKIEMEYYGLNFESEPHPEACITVDNQRPWIGFLCVPRTIRSDIQKSLIHFYPEDVVNELLECFYTEGYEE